MWGRGGGFRNCFGDVFGGENKMTYGQRGGGGFHVFRQVLEGGRFPMCSIGLSIH